MTRPIISVENLGKRYTLRHQANGHAGYRRFSEELSAALARPLRALWKRGAGSTEQGARSREHGTPSGNGDHSPRPLAGEGQGVRASDASREDFWALRDVSFDVQEGEVLGIIGRNGAGKSTLLKVLSRITEPTEGRVTIRGRVASLLEVGTGFHPELTGRENVYLNGAVLGMSRAEIRRKFDEIVDFAGVDRFLDTPVKRYSSGMYVRLAFAVAAHLEPEILVVDEVLAVGDAEFQKKCLGKMESVARGGRTVLFVSHNMAAVQSICQSGAVLNSGAIEFVGPSSAAVEHYLATLSTDHGGFKAIGGCGTSRSATDCAMQAVTLTDALGTPTAHIVMGGKLSIIVDYCSPTPVPSPVLGVVIKSLRTGAILGINNRIVPGYDFRQPGNRRTHCLPFRCPSARRGKVLLGPIPRKRRARHRLGH